MRFIDEETGLVLNMRNNILILEPHNPDENQNWNIKYTELVHVESNTSFTINNVHADHMTLYMSMEKLVKESGYRCDIFAQKTTQSNLEILSIGELKKLAKLLHIPTSIPFANKEYLLKYIMNPPKDYQMYGHDDQESFPPFTYDESNIWDRILKLSRDHINDRKQFLQAIRSKYLLIHLKTINPTRLALLCMFVNIPYSSYEKCPCEIMGIMISKS